MTGSIFLVDKKTDLGVFRFEERINSPQFKNGVDYTVDGSRYFILSPQLKKDILITQNPYNENIDVSELEMKILVDRQDEINIKPQIVRDLERREKLIEVGRGINDFSNRGIGSSDKVREIEDSSVYSMEVDKSEGSLTKKSLLTDSEIEKASKSELVSLIKRIEKELETREKSETNSSSFCVDSSELKIKKQKSQQKLEKLEKLEKSYSLNELGNNPKSNNSPTNLIIGGILLAVIGLVSFLFIRKTIKKKLK